MEDEFVLEFLIKTGFKFSWRLLFRKLEKLFLGFRVLVEIFIDAFFKFDGPFYSILEILNLRS